MKVGRWSTTANNNNATPPDGWPEGQAPSTVNDCAREMMAQIRTMINDIAFIDLDQSPTQTSSTTFTLPGNVVSFYPYGTRVKALDATTLYGTVVSSSFTTNTGITLRLDSGILTTSLTAVAVSALKSENIAVPDTVFRARNALRNYALDVWQRGNSFGLSGSAISQVIAGGFRIFANSGASFNVTRQERSANASNVPTLAQAGQLLNSSICISVSAADAAIGASDYAFLTTTIEGADWREFAQKPFTYTMWVNTNRTGTYCVSFRNAGADRVYVAEYSVSAISTWEKKTFTIPEHPSAGTWDYSIGVGLTIAMGLAAGTSQQTTNANQWTATSALATANQQNFLASAGHTIKFAGMKLNEGTKEMPIEVRTFHEELIRDFRYTRMLFEGDRATGLVVTTSKVLAHYYLGTPMRTTPTLSLPSLTTLATYNAAVGDVSISAVVIFGFTNKTLMFDVGPVGAPLTVGQGSMFMISAGTGAAITIDAEL